MLTNPNADPHSAYVKKKLKVTVDADTLFDASAKEDLKPGRDVQMVGLDLKDGNIRATRLRCMTETGLFGWGSGRCCRQDRQNNCHDEQIGISAAMIVTSR
jgi:hypothetical protein